MAPGPLPAADWFVPVTHLLLGVDPGMVRSAAGRGAGAIVTPPLPRDHDYYYDCPPRNPATVPSHLCCCFSPFRRGKCCVFLLLFFSGRFGIFCLFFAVLLRVAVGNQFSGANFCFLASRLVLCFSMVFCMCFCFRFWHFAPETVRKNSLNVRSSVFGSLSLRFSVVGSGNCTVTLALLFFFSFFRRLKCGPFMFFLFFSGRFGVLCPFCSSSLLRVAVGNKFLGANFFWVSRLILCFFDGVLPRFLFQVLALRFRNCSKILSTSGREFLGSFVFS